MTMMRSLLASTLAPLLAAFALAGCVTTAQNIGPRAVPAAEVRAAEAAAQPAPPSAPSAPQPVAQGQLRYLLQAGDQIEVKLYHHPELNEQLVIGPDQRIALQLVGELPVQDMSVGQLAEELTRRYASQLRNPQTTVILRKYALPRVFVAGEVNQPAAHALEGGRLTALQAIAQSGGFRKGAERANVIVLRHSGSAQPLFIKLDLQGHLEQNLEADLPLQPYDVVFVPQRRIAEVAEFFDEYVGRIVPIYRNMGLSFSYPLRNEVQVQSR